MDRKMETEKEPAEDRSGRLSINYASFTLYCVF
jgi:hypothetical protein